MGDLFHMIRRKRILCLCISLILILGIAGILISLCVEYSHRPENIFPMWEEPIEPKEDQPGVVLTLTGIDFNEPALSPNDDPRDVLHIRAKIPSGQPVGHGEYCWIDYFYEDQWHTVWMLPGSGVERLSFYSCGENDLKRYVPAGIFQKEGQYRIYVDSLGYCEFEHLLTGG